MPAIYSLLFVAFASVYAPPLPTGTGWRISLWHVLLATALIVGLVQSQLVWSAIAGVIALGAFAELSFRGRPPAFATTSRAAAILLAMALALHLVPGFPDPAIARGVRLSPASVEMTLRANFDKGVAGLLLLGYFSARPGLKEWPRVLAIGLGFGVAFAAIVVGIAVAFDAVRFDPKLPYIALYWVPINLFLTCVFEEMLFRGLLQRWLSNRLEHRPQLRWVPIAAASTLFGLAHAGGGLVLIIAAGIAGIGYGLAYQMARRIEAAIVAHFTLNAVHFFFFTYPYAAR